MPERLKLSRRKGFSLQEASLALNGLRAVKVDRSTRWGNPFSRKALTEGGQCGCPNCQVVSFEGALSEAGRDMIRRELVGVNIACWCPLDRMCHGDIILAIANGHEPRLPTELANKDNPDD